MTDNLKQQLKEDVRRVQAGVPSYNLHQGHLYPLLFVSGLQVGVQQLHGDHPVDLALEIKRTEKKDHQARRGDAQDGDALLQVARGVELKDAASLEGQPDGKDESRQAQKVETVLNILLREPQGLAEFVASQ